MLARIISSSLPTVETKYPLAQNLWPRKLRALRSTFCATQIELFPLRYPITSATEYFGGIDIRMWVPRCRRICPNSTFLRYFGVNATWYLHSHVAWFRWL